MSSPIPLPLFHAARRLLRAGMRHCDIARQTGLSLWTIGRLASDGRHHAPRDASPHAEREDYLVRSALDNLLANDEPLESEFNPADLPEDDAPPGYDAARLRRCPGCGGMVYQWPCLTCRARAGVSGQGSGDRGQRTGDISEAQAAASVLRTRY